jgi:hypothetical protein
MSRYHMVLASAGAVCLFAIQLHAQTNPAPSTYLETFEQQTNIVLVKGFSLVGTLALGNGTISVHANEASDVSHGQKAFGIVLETSQSTEADRVALVVDYDELDSLANGIDYISKVTWGVTRLNGFEASYATRSGFRVIAHSDRRQSSIDTFIQFGGGPRLPATADQLGQLRSLVVQAKAALDGLK